MDIANLPELSVLQKQSLALRYGHMLRGTEHEQGVTDEECDSVYQNADEIQNAAALVRSAVLEVCSRVLVYTIVSTLKMTNVASQDRTQVAIPRATSAKLIDQLVLTLQSGYHPILDAAKQQTRNSFHSNSVNCKFGVLKNIVAGVEGAYMPTAIPSNTDTASFLRSQYSEIKPLEVKRIKFTKTTLGDILDCMDSTVVTYCDWLIKYDSKSKTNVFGKCMQSALNTAKAGGVLNSIAAVIRSFKDDYTLLEPGLSSVIYGDVKEYTNKILSCFCAVPYRVDIQDAAILKISGRDAIIWMNPNMTPHAYDVPPSVYSNLANTAAVGNLRNPDAIPLNVQFEHLGKQGEMDYATYVMTQEDNSDYVPFLLGRHAEVTFEQSQAPISVETTRPDGTLHKRAAVKMDIVMQTVTMSKSRFYIMMSAFRTIQETVAASALRTAGRLDPTDREKRLNGGGGDDHSYTNENRKSLARTEMSQCVKAWEYLQAHLPQQRRKMLIFADQTAVDVLDELASCLGYRKNMPFAGLICMAIEENLELDLLLEFSTASKAEREDFLQSSHAGGKSEGKQKNKGKGNKKAYSGPMDAAEMMELGILRNQTESARAPEPVITELVLLEDRIQDVFCELAMLVPAVSTEVQSHLADFVKLAFLTDACRPETRYDDDAIVIHVGPQSRLIPASLTTQTKEYLHAPYIVLCQTEFASWPLLGKILLKLFTCDFVDVNIRPDESMNQWMQIANSPEYIDGVPRWIDISRRVMLATANALRVGTHPFNPVFHDIAPIGDPQIFVGLEFKEQQRSEEQPIQISLAPLPQSAQMILPEAKLFI